MRNLTDLSRIEREVLAAAYRERDNREARALQSAPGGLIHFVRYFWPILEPGRPFVYGWPLEAICLHLEAVARGEISRLLINVPPGFAKSLICDVFFPAWLWGPFGQPHKRFVAFSYASHLTERDNGRFRDLVRSKEYQALWGHVVQLTEDGKVRVANSKMGFKFASSVGGVGTGERGDFVVLDDPHNVKESESEVVRTETVRWFCEAMQNRLNDLSDGAIIVIMQRVHEADVSGTILDDYPEYVHLCIPMRYEPERHCATGIWEDPRTEDGELAWPERFPENVLLPFERYPYLWAGQYQQRPSPRGGGVLPLSAWEIWDKDLAARYGRNENQFPDLEYVVAYLDTAYTLKKQNDPSACVVLGVWRDGYDQPRVIVMNCWSERLTLHDLVERSAETCRRYRVDRLVIEAKASGISVAQEMARLHAGQRWMVDLDNPGTQDKLARAYSIQHFLGEDLPPTVDHPQGDRRDGVVYVPYVTDQAGGSRPRLWAEQLMNECASFPNGEHDDRVDAFVGGLRHLRGRGYLLRSDEFAQIQAEELGKSHVPPEPLYPGVSS